MPNANNREAAQVLRDLVAALRDSEEGFAKAARGAHSDALRDVFSTCSRQRARYAAELEEEIRALGAGPSGAAHFGGILRGWVDLKARIRPRDDGAFIEECVQGESGTLQHYDRALARPLPGGLRERIEHQRRGVEQAIEQLDRAGVAFKTG